MVASSKATSGGHGEAPPGSASSRIAIAGLVFSVLFVLAWILLRDSPALEASDEELIGYYGDPQSRRGSAFAALFVVPFACIAFIWFMATLRDRSVRVGVVESRVLSTAHVVAGALVVTSLFTVAAVELAVVWLAETTGTVDVGGTRSLLALGAALSDIMAIRAAAVFVGVSGARAVQSGLFPRSYGVLSLLTALALLLVYQAATWVSLLFPVWVAASSVVLLVRRYSVGAADEHQPG